MKNENAYEEKASKILHYLKADIRHGTNFLPRPFFFELTGTPDAGKTTSIKESYNFLRLMKFKVLMPQEGAEVIQHIERTTPEYNIRTGLYALTQLMDLSTSHAYDVVIFDRCIFDDYCWMMYWRGKEKLTDQETAMIQQFFLSRFWANRIDLSIFMVCDPEEAMRRGKRIAISKKMGATSNPATIKTLVDRYKSAFYELRPEHPQLRLINTTRMKEREMIDKVTGLLLDAMENKVSQSVAQ